MGVLYAIGQAEVAVGTVEVPVPPSGATDAALRTVKLALLFIVVQMTHIAVILKKMGKVRAGITMWHQL